MLVAVKADRRAVGRLLAVTITVLQTFAVQLADMTLVFAVFKGLLTNHGADMTHGIMFQVARISAAVAVFQELTAVNTGWVATLWAATFGQVAVEQLLFPTADAVGVVGLLVV